MTPTLAPKERPMSTRNNPMRIPPVLVVIRERAKEGMISLPAEACSESSRTSLMAEPTFDPLNRIWIPPKILGS